MKNKNIQTIHMSLMIVVVLMAVTMAACSGQEPDQTIVDTTWQWAQLIETEPASQSLVPNPENFTLNFETDGTISIKADCNMVSGTYDLDGSVLSIEMGMSTMAFCGEESLDTHYLGLLSSVESFHMDEGSLYLDLQNGSGSMTFQEG